MVFEQAGNYQRIGADINLTPNAVRALDSLGVGPGSGKPPRSRRIASAACGTPEKKPHGWKWRRKPKRKYGAPQLTIHRADLLDALRRQLPEEVILFGHRIEAIDVGGTKPKVRFANGTAREVDVLVGADGIHSVTRTALFGPEHPQFTGLVSYRAVVDRTKLKLAEPRRLHQMVGPDAGSADRYIPAQSRPGDLRFRDDIATAMAVTNPGPWPAMSNELRKAYAGFHPEARALLDACESVTKSALYVRDPLPNWSVGRVTLLGDACHPMVPFMAQGACMAVEDAVVLGRALENVESRGDRSRAEALRKHTKRTDRARTDRVSRQRVAQGRRQCRLGLWLYRQRRAIGASQLALSQRMSSMKIVIPDDYQNLVDRLACYDLIRQYDITRYREPARDIDQLVERLADADVVVSIRERVEVPALCSSGCRSSS